MILPPAIKVLKGLILHLGGDTGQASDTIASPFMFL